MRNEKNCEQTEYSYSCIIYSLFSCNSYGYYVLSERRKEINIEFCAKNYDFLDFIPKGNKRIEKKIYALKLLAKIHIIILLLSKKMIGFDLPICMHLENIMQSIGINKSF